VSEAPKVGLARRGSPNPLIRQEHNESAYPLIADMGADIAERQQSAKRRH